MDASDLIHHRLQAFAEAVKAKTAGLVLGQPEEQLRAPFENFVAGVATTLGWRERMERMKGWVVMNKHDNAGGRAMRIIAVVVASLALAGAVNAQAQTGAWKVGSGTPVTLKGSNPATGEPNSSSLAVGCNLRTGRIYGGVSVIPFFFPNGKAVLTWDEREDVLRTFEGMEGFDYPAIFLLTEDLSFLDNIIGHNRLTVSAEVEIEGRRARMESRFDLSGSQAAFRTLRCWPPSARPAPSNPPIRGAGTCASKMPGDVLG